MRNAIALRFALLAFLTTAAAAQTFSTLERGFAPNKLYSFGDFDVVNTFNGNLALSIPIGLEYPVDGGLKYRLTLHYNSKVWDYEQVVYMPTGQTFTSVVPNRDSNAGMGWILNLGRLSSPQDSSNTLEKWNYLSPDGSRHAVSATVLHPNSGPTSLSGNVTAATYSKDGTYMRMLTRSAGGSPEIDTPDGLKRTFIASTGDLAQLSDQFGNSVSVLKYTSVGSTPCSRMVGGVQMTSSAWLIGDAVRSNWVCFTNQPFAYTESAYNGEFIDRVIVAAPHGATATYQFQYSFPSIEGMNSNCGSTYVGDPAYWENLPMLTGLVLPDGSSLAFTYNENNTLNGVTGCSQGTLASVTLPTQAKISYSYSGYILPQDPCPGGTVAQNGGGGTALRTAIHVVTGVSTRTITGPGLTDATWTWTSAANTSSLYELCPLAVGGYDYYPAPGDQWTVTTTDPDHNVTEHYYSIWEGADNLYQSNGNNSFTLLRKGYPVASEHGALSNEYALPFTRLITSANRFLSVRQYTPTGYTNGTPVRSEYVLYEYDDTVRCTPNFPNNESVNGNPNCENANQRVSSSQVVYHDDGNRTADTEFSDFDGFGHFRKTVTDGTFESGNVRSSYTGYNPGVDSNGNVGNSFAFSSAANWILGSYGDQWVNENGHTAKSENCFVNGFLTVKRVLAGDATDVTGLSQSGSDVVIALTNDGHGNVQMERYFGGDTCGTLALIGGCSTAPSCVPVGVAACSAVPAAGVPAYDLHHTYSKGLLSTSQYYQCDDVTAVGFKAVDRDIDAAGVVTSARDVSERPTAYYYDTSGRPTSIEPAGRATSSYVYSNASYSTTNGFTPAEVQITRSDTSSRVQFDSFGRVWREFQTMPVLGEVRRETAYDMQGRKTSTSEWDTVTTPRYLAQYSYDMFGRIKDTTMPDGSITRFSYAGDSSMTRTKKVATSTTAQDDVPVTEYYDRQGRLCRVVERSGPTTSTSVTGTDVTTTYTYGVSDRMRAVKMAAASGPVQNRLFDYDGRGFLRWESQPESGMASYQYDARGHVASRTQSEANSQFDLKFYYDAAERSTRIEARNPLYDPNPSAGEPQFHAMKEFEYGTDNAAVGNGQMDYRKGKLVTAIRHNYGERTSEPEYSVKDAYKYVDDAGRKTDRTTTLSELYHGGGGWTNVLQTLSTSMAYNDLDLPTTVTYPMCTDCGVPPSDPDRSLMTRGYSRGRLTSFSNVATSISYWPDGLRDVLLHANGIADTQTVSNMPRTSRLQFGTYDRCVRPTFITQPASVPMSGTGVTLSVTVSGTGTFEYQWWDVTHSTPAGTTQSITVSPTSTTSYYVTVSNPCGFEQSQVAKVTVNECPAPATGFIQAVVQPDGSWILKPNPVARQPRTYSWKRMSDNAIVGVSETLPVTTLSTTTTYQLTITDECGSGSGSVIVSVPLPITAGLHATASLSPLSVSVDWPQISGATQYTVERRSLGAAWETAGTTNATTFHFIDTNVVTSRTYVYRVTTDNGGKTNSDVATTLQFTQAVAGQVITAAPMNSMLDAVNKVREAAGWTSVTWSNILAATDPLPAPGAYITARQLMACRARMNEALQALGVVVGQYTDPDLYHLTIKASYINEVEAQAQ